MLEEGLKLAVLIDGDNVPADSMDRLFATIQTVGEPMIRRLYGGSQLASKKWAEAAERHALSFGRRLLHAKGCNATDIEMVIGAMDLLTENLVEGFCIVSSDGDFTPLAVRLREAGKTVYGYGHVAPEGFRNACHQFFVMESDGPLKKNGNVVPFARSGIHFAVAGMKRVIAKHAKEDGWVLLSKIGTEIGSEIPGFKVKHYGAPSLKKLSVKAGCFDLKETDRGDTMVRIRSAAR